MARTALEVAVLIYYVELLSLVCGMPPTQTGSMSPPLGRLPLHRDGGVGVRVQCPGCLHFFKSETGLRHHRGALGRLGSITKQTGCAVDTRQSVISEWTGEGRAAAGTVRDFAAEWVYVPGMTDSDADGNHRDERPGHQVPDNGDQGDEPLEDEQLPNVVAPPQPLPVHIHTHTYIYLQHKYTYMHIYAHTYIHE